MITVDARWWRSSGIGTYIKNVVPRLIDHFPHTRFSLIGDLDDLAHLASDRVSVIVAPTKMYSLGKIFIPRTTVLFFAPHYPIPLSYHGTLITTVHDVCHLARPEFSPGIAKRVYATLMFQAVRFKSAAIICVSQFSADELKRYVGAESVVIHNGIAPEWFKESSLPRPMKAPYVIYVGNVKPHKNVGNLVKAYQTIRRLIPHELVIVGKREGFITGDQLADTSGVEFTGRVSDDELRAWVRHADALVFPSFYEGFGFPPLEAMACGIPAVVANTSSLPEICGDAALYCDPHSPEDIAARIMEALDRGDLKAKGIARARQFTWDACAGKTAEVIRSHVNVH